MRPLLVGVIVLGSVIAGTLSSYILFRMFNPPDTSAAILAVLWVAMPYLAAIGLALLCRRHIAALVVLLIALAVTASVGVFLFDASATQEEIAQQQAANAVLPGEDPDHGPAAQRRAAADIGLAANRTFGVLIAMVLPPIQVAVVLVPAVIAFGISAWVRYRREKVLESADGRGPSD